MKGFQIPLEEEKRGMGEKKINEDGEETFSGPEGEKTQSINEEGEDDDSGEKMAESRVLIWEMREEKRGKEKTREMRMKGD